MSIRQIHLTLALTVLLVIGIGAPASAQPPITDVPLKSGTIYWVTRTDGSEIKGFITERTAEEVRVNGALGPVAIPAPEVLRIAKPDGLRNGFLIGASVGVAMFAPYALDPDLPAGAARRVGATATVALMYGGIGALIDKAFEGRTDVYRRASSPSVSLAPIASARRLGLRATVRW